MQLFAPFTLGLGIKNTPKIQSIKVEAAILYSYNKISFSAAGVSEVLSTSTPKILNECNADRTADEAASSSQTGISYSQCKEAVANAQTTTVGALSGTGVTPTQQENSGGLPPCGITSGDGLKGCGAQLLYYIFFVPTSFVFGLSGRALDFTFMYSLSDVSYRSEFVLSGWGIVRDFCNMFFIFVLLYIAFGTILELHSVKTKEMIINVVIIGLLINFSLFTTQVIIDTSNILARVFYNDKTIITGTVQKDESGNPLPVVSERGDLGEIKLSEAIVSKVNPVAIITSSAEVGKIKSKGLDTSETDNSGGISIGGFIIVVFLSTAINIVGTIAFASSALIFIGRVVMLWLSMILAPLAFFSYIVPQLQDIKMIGWKKWWPDLLSMAFVAPVFAFFMYLIVGFLSKGLGVMDAMNTPGGLNASGLTFVLKIIVPFAFIMILLMKAKDVAVSMSGQIGESLSKAGGAVGGIALGAMTGGAALAMRASVGRLGGNIENNSYLAKKVADGGLKGRMAAKLIDIGSGANKASFDVRNTKAGAATGKNLGVDFGKAKEGGYKKAIEDKAAKRTTRLAELKTMATRGDEVEKRKTEVGKKLVENNNSHKLHEIEDKLTKAKQDMAETADPAEKMRLSNEIKELKAEKTSISLGGKTGKKNPDGSDEYATDNGKIGKTYIESLVKAKTEAEAKVNKIEGAPTAEYNLDMERIAKMKSDAESSPGGMTPEKETKIKEAKYVADLKFRESKDKSEQDLQKAKTDLLKATNEANAALALERNGTGKSIASFGSDIKNITHKIEDVKNKVAKNQSDYIGSTTNKIANIFSMSGRSVRGTSEARDNMILGIQTKSSESHGGGGGHSAPVAPAPKPAAVPKPASSGHDSHGGGHH